LNQLTANCLKIHKIISTVSILCYLQLNHRTIISGLKDISTRSQTTLQNYIDVPSSYVAYPSIILSFRTLYIAYLFFYYFTCFTILTAFIDHVRLLHVFLPARRCASAVFAVRHTPVLCLAERKQDSEMYTSDSPMILVSGKV